MKKVLIAIDYNPAAEKVAEAGFEFAKALNAEVNIVHVVAEPACYSMEYSAVMGYQGGYVTGAGEAIEEIKKEAKKFLTATVKHLDDKNIKTKVLEGETTEEIIKYAEIINPSLIVLGSHNHKGMDRIFVTDVSAYFLKHSNYPLLVIPVNDTK